MTPTLASTIDRFSLSLPFSPFPDGLHQALSKARAVSDESRSETPTPAVLEGLAREINAFATQPLNTHVRRKWLVDFSVAVRSLIPPPPAIA